jgi:hypothetical protein
MPFTFSHPAAIFPLRLLPNKLYSITGLIVGSIIPDFEYFLRMNVRSIYSHTLWGLFYFDIPFGIAICFLFHDVVRNDLIDHLPANLQQRFSELKTFKWNIAFKQHWYVVVISILIGSISHILWDDFTHPLGYFVNKYAFLRNKVQISSYSIPVYNILQNLSSLIGGIIVLYFIGEMPRTKTQLSQKRDYYWPLTLIIIIAVMSLRFLNGLTLTKYGNVIVSFISSFFIAIIFLSVIGRYGNNRLHLKS